jgi:hypothetical protein
MVSGTDPTGVEDGEMTIMEDMNWVAVTTGADSSVADVLTDGEVVWVADFWVVDMVASDDDHTTRHASSPSPCAIRHYRL